ncbi:MAG: hydroxymethylbilane synthase [Polyangiaceae bacterium]|nr:hydroxymethylbilane synthase [Polyangiaceae bacterium]
MKLILATRRSALALAQSRAFAETLKRVTPGLEIEELHVVTSGDKTQDKPLTDIGGKGLFIKELEEALLDGRADFAVHSIKDVPATVPPSLVLAAIPKREDPRDVLVTRSGAKLADLPAGARVGTGSLRRALSLKQARPDLVIEPIRGNVDTRLRKVDEGQFDGVVLALAGLKRLGLTARATDILDPSISLPAIGQGALGIECRLDDKSTIEVLSSIIDRETSICVCAERAVMAAVDGNCRTPVAAYAEREGDKMRLRALLAEPDGSNLRTVERVYTWPASEAESEAFGKDAAAALKPVSGAS